jgi:hypothetical protein
VTGRHSASQKQHMEKQLSTTSTPQNSSKTLLNVTVSAKIAAPGASGAQWTYEFAEQGGVTALRRPNAKLSHTDPATSPPPPSPH